ncbi:MAG: acyl-CoA thioesterase [Sandaracinaceae bacterium]
MKPLRAAPPKSAVEILGRVPFHDVDALHIVWHGHYYKYMEVARTELFQKAKVDGPDMIDLGYRFVVAHGECRYVSPLRYDDRYRVKCWFLDTELRVHVAYEIWNLTEEKRAARARTELVTLDPAGVLMLETPQIIRDRIRASMTASNRL